MNFYGAGSMERQNAEGRMEKFGDASFAVMFPASRAETSLFSKLRGLNDSKQLDEEQRFRVG